jgi:hypothetical protein
MGRSTGDCNCTRVTENGAKAGAEAFESRRKASPRRKHMRTVLCGSKSVLPVAVK